MIDALGRQPRTVTPRQHQPLVMPREDTEPKPVLDKLTGIDVFIETRRSPEQLAQALQRRAAGLPLVLKMISNRGLQVWPVGSAFPELADVYRCRFLAAAQGTEPDDDAIAELLRSLSSASGDLRWVHVEKLRYFAGERGYTLAQGED